MDKNQSFSAVSLSGGKDSTFMLLRMIELEMPIDAVLFADTGMEFPEFYSHLQKLDEHLFRERGIHITIASVIWSDNIVIFAAQKGGYPMKYLLHRLVVPP